MNRKGGLLSKKAIIKARDLRGKNKKLYRLIHEINLFAEKTKYKIFFNGRDPKQYIPLCLYLRVIEGAQASILLIERGFDIDSAINVRAIFEALIFLKLSCTDKKFVNEYMLLPEAQRLEKIYKALNDPSDELYSELLSSAPKYNSKIEELIIEIKTNLNTFSIPANNLKEVKKFLSKFEKRSLAEQAGYLNHYRTFYNVTSDFVHINPKTLMRFIELDKAGNISRIIHGPCDEHSELHLITLADLLIAALFLISGYFHLQLEKTISKYQQKLNNLS